jgi:small nuclear ribonucleoprotein (snRNP)-like protein
MASEVVAQELKPRTKAGPHDVPIGIEGGLNEKAREIVSKTVEKIVRVEVSDGRKYIGMLTCVDQQKAIFVQDALEIIDRANDPTFQEHELLTPHLLQHAYSMEKYQSKILKAVGSIVITRKHIVKVQLDKKFQRLYDQHTKPRLPKITEAKSEATTDAASVEESKE